MTNNIPSEDKIIQVLRLLTHKIAALTDEQVKLRAEIQSLKNNDLQSSQKVYVKNAVERSESHIDITSLGMRQVGGPIKANKGNICIECKLKIEIGEAIFFHKTQDKLNFSWHAKCGTNDHKARIEKYLSNPDTYRSSTVREHMRDPEFKQKLVNIVNKAPASIVEVQTNEPYETCLNYLLKDSLKR